MNEFKIRKGLIVQGSGSTILDVLGSQGELFSITDSLSGSLFSVNDISGLPIMEVFSDNTIKMGTFNQEAIIVSGSRTGMGTAFPQAKLHISGANADALLRVGSPAQANILFVSGSGFIGVGTTTPGVALDVVGGSIRTSNTIFTSATQTNTIQLNTGTNLRFFSSSIETARYDNNGWGFFNTAPAAKVHISGANADNLFRVSSPSATNALFVSGSGNVGIGTTTPSTTLNVNGTTLLQDGQTTVRGSGATSATTAFRVENSNATASLVVLDNGNAGIGTTSPITKLHVSGNIYTEDNLIIPSGKDILIRDVVDDTTGTIIRGTYDRSGIDPNFDYVSTSSIFLAGLTNTRIDLFGTNTTYIGGLPNFGRILFTIPNSGNALFSSPSNANILFVSGSGDVGIGTGTPGVTLDVVGSIRASNTMFNSVTQTNNIQLSSAFLRFLSASVETARYDNNGWGFFNTAPTAKVHISGANADALLRVGSPTNANILLVSGSGNIGIGTTSPSSKLHISGANAIMTLSPIDPLPTTNIPSASFATSGSGADLKPYFWNGSTWTALF